jgi:transporter family protein
LKDVTFVILGGLIAGFLVQWTYYVALKQGSASSVAPVASVYPLVAFILSVIFLQEVLSWQKILGVVFVVTGVILIK